MERKNLWEEVYKTKLSEAVSWYQPHLTKSLELIAASGIDRNANIIDVGGGASTLADVLLVNGYKRITVLDISSKAIEVSKRRLDNKADQIAWVEADILEVEFPKDSFDLWHDRAVFHFLTNPADRKRYINTLRDSLRFGGNVILSTFGLNGPSKCSGLDVIRYDSQSLSKELGNAFGLTDSLTEKHTTPRGMSQEFIFCRFKKI